MLRAKAGLSGTGPTANPKALVVGPLAFLTGANSASLSTVRIPRDSGAIRGRKPWINNSNLYPLGSAGVIYSQESGSTQLIYLNALW